MEPTMEIARIEREQPEDKTPGYRLSGLDVTKIESAIWAYDASTGAKPLGELYRHVLAD